MIILNKNGYTVYRTGTRRCACYIIESNQYCVLIDTSMPFERNVVVKSIRKSIGEKKIDAIFLTHSHTDHVANAQYFSDIYRCKVYISEKGLTNMRQGSCTMPKGTNLFSNLINKVEHQISFYQFTRFQACAYSEPLNNEVVKFYLGESAELLETPGHTNDSISILLDNQIAVVGDTMVNSLGHIYPPFADDENAVIISWKTLLATQCQLFYPAHGSPLSRDKLILAYHKVQHGTDKNRNLERRRLETNERTDNRM